MIADVRMLILLDLEEVTGLFLCSEISHAIDLITYFNLPLFELITI